MTLMCQNTLKIQDFLEKHAGWGCLCSGDHGPIGPRILNSIKPLARPMRRDEAQKASQSVTWPEKARNAIRYGHNLLILLCLHYRRRGNMLSRLNGAR